MVPVAIGRVNALAASVATGRVVLVGCRHDAAARERPMAYETRLLGDGFAAEILGADLRRDFSDAEIDDIRAQWMAHKIAVFRGQDLSSGDLMRFTQRFGRLFVHIRSQFQSPEHPEVMLVSNAKADGRAMGALGDGELGWHTDQAYTPEPVFATLLYGVAIPSQGGNTVFCDLSRSWRDLPAALRQRVAGRRVQYSIDKPAVTQGIRATDAQRAQLPDTIIHPVARRHPYLDRVALYISPDHLVTFEGLSVDESAALMRELIAFAAQPPRVYAHQWRVGDVIMWDNSQVMHRRSAFPPDETRTLKRTGFYLPMGRAVPVAA